MKIFGGLPLIVIWGGPLLLSIAYAVAPFMDLPAWGAFLSHPQVWPALALSLWTGTASTALSLLLAIIIIAGAPKRIAGLAGLALSLPHLAFAIGFGFLIMPSGWIARLLVGGSSPPGWITTQDPWGLSLIAALVLKETPFLVWIFWSLLTRSDLAEMLTGQTRAAKSLGHGTRSIWLRVLLPQLLPRLLWPLAIVWAYGATVIDMALAIGPTQPPTLAEIVWSDLNDADAANNARGAAGAAFLTMVLAVIGIVVRLLMITFNGPWRRFASLGPSSAAFSHWPSRPLVTTFAAIYAAVIVLLAVLSVSGQWPYPELVPCCLKLSAWMSADYGAFETSAAIAILAALVSAAIAILWLESIPERFDPIVSAAAAAALILPAVLFFGGQYRAFLRLGLTGTALGLFLAHLTPAFAYAWIVLKGPYRAFDPRYRAIAKGLGVSGWRFWWTAKMPLLKPALLSALAVGFAVSIAQFVGAQLMAAGRFSTLPMEAVTLASGGNRALTAAFALLLSIPPALAFLGAAWFSRPRWDNPWA